MKTAKKTHWLLTTILVLVACGIVGLILSAVLFFRDPGPTYASATLVLTFDGAAEGIAPNGLTFDLQDLDCDDVLSEGLKVSGLDGVYTPEQIRPSLTVQGVYPDDMANQVTHYESLMDFETSRELTVGDYHPTTFNIKLTNTFDRSISREKLTELLEDITAAYRDYFSRVYAYGLDQSGYIFELENYDYPQQLHIIEGYLASVSAYAQELYEKDPTFRFQGTGFNDISVRLNNLIDNSITQLSADLTINALTRDTDRMLNQYQYNILDLGTQREKKYQELNKLDQLIASYEKNEIIYVSTSDSLTKIDGNSSETYDALVDRRKEVADGITDLGKQIATYELLVTDLMNSSATLQPNDTETVSSDDEAESVEGEITIEVPVVPTPEEIAAAEQELSNRRTLLEENIRALVADSDTVISDFAAMLDDYNTQQINELTVAVTKTAYKTPEIVSGAFVIKAVKTAGPIVALGFMLCMLLIAISRRKEEKNRG